MMVSKKDREILEIIQNNSRTSIADISRHVGLSENGVRYRLEKLEKTDYIRSYTALLNPVKFGKNVMAIFRINPLPKRTEEIIEMLTALEELDAIYQTTGSYSIMAAGLFKDNEELNRFVTERLAQDGISDFTFDVVTKKHKEGPFSI